MKAEKTVVLSVTKKVVRMAEYWEYMKADMMADMMVDGTVGRWVVSMVVVSADNWAGN